MRKPRTKLPTAISRQASGPKPKIDIIKVLKFRAQGVTNKDIAILLKCSASQISVAVGNLGKLLDNEDGRLTAYRNHEADILVGYSLRSKL